MNILDSHIHIWDLKTSGYSWLDAAPEILKRSFNINELSKPREAAGVTQGILVQADNTLEDTELMLESAVRNDWIKGVVGWLPLMQPESVVLLLEDKFLNEKLFCGVRHLIHDEKDPRWLLQERVIESLKILAEKNIPYDVVGILNEHINTALKVAEKVPDLKMVFDHMNQPPITGGERFGEWGILMKEAARHEKFYIKISGLGTCAGDEHFNKELLTPYVEFVLNNFGVDKCFCGGDWPVSLLAGDYAKTWGVYKSVLNGLLAAAAFEKVLYLNARIFYDLKV